MSENTGSVEKKDVYTLFETFLNSFKNGKSLFSDKEIFREEEINKVIKSFIDNADSNKESNFMQKINNQLKTDKEKDILANAIWLWSFAVEDITLKTKLKQVNELLRNDEEKEKEKYKNFFSTTPIMPGGQYHKTNKYFELTFIIALFQHLLDKKTEELGSIKNSIIEYIKNDRNPDNTNKLKSEKKIATQNILLHLCAPVSYEQIANYNHKKAIVDTFSILINDYEDNDEALSKIRKYLQENLGGNWKGSFYREPITSFWNFKGNDSDAEFSEFDALKNKKQIVFYGPPGTSKTYSAKKLAEMLIRQSYIQTEDINTVLMMDFKEEFEQRILNLQLHQNYSYEDFIVGMKIVNNETKWEKGYLLKLIDKINEENADNKKNKELPYILILDEINRVDLSRLFGELFSAIENRDETVKLSAIDESNKEFLGLKVPENLYFIGTMNQIDFSLERIDFALRRRFVWYFYGYNEIRLREIIDFKCVKSETKIEIKPEHIDELVRRASAINESLEKDEDFGKEWEIGHTFFAEIVDILISLDKTKKNYMLYVKSQDGKLTTAKEPVNVLWHISIKPMLEAYCGNLDKKTKKDKLDKLANIFLKGTK
jgi:5-methylcytosine-specific restriction protein B